jgi:hypothetical protein
MSRSFPARVIIVPMQTRERSHILPDGARRVDGEAGQRAASMEKRVSAPRRWREWESARRVDGKARDGRSRDGE